MRNTSATLMRNTNAQQLMSESGANQWFANC
jgi:hypothetical protein